MTYACLRDVHRAYVDAVQAFLSPYEATREATLVIEALTGLSRTQQSVRGGDDFEGDAARFAEIIDARLARQPLAQILGFAAFRDRMFHVTPDVLCPRADTECLVEAALAFKPRSLLDLGTGPGTLALTLLAELPEARGVATDISQPALAVAMKNAEALGVSERVEIRASDWLQQVEGTFDLIVSNPPYVDADTYSNLAPEITRWEPKIALTPGGDGLEPYRILAAQAPAFLRIGGALMVEIGFDQGALVAAMFRRAGLSNVDVTQDLNGKDRVVSGFRT